MKNLFPKVIFVALIVGIPGLFMLAFNSDLPSKLNLNIPTSSQLFGRLMNMLPHKEQEPTKFVPKPDEVYCKINEKNDENPNHSSSYVKKYTLAFNVTEQNPDLRVDYVEPFTPTTSSHYIYEKTSVSPDKTKVTVTFTLTSGPSSDPYTGWVDGLLTIHVKNIKEASASK